jgi:hypothetical protein
MRRCARRHGRAVAMDPATPSLTFARSNAPCGHRRYMWSCEGVHVALSPRSAAPAECESEPYRHGAGKRASVLANCAPPYAPQPGALPARRRACLSREGRRLTPPPPRLPPVNRRRRRWNASRSTWSVRKTTPRSSRWRIRRRSRGERPCRAARADARMPRRRRGSPLEPTGAASMNTSRHPRNLRSPSWTSARSSTCLSWQRSPSRRTTRRGSTESASARRAG